MESGSPLPPFGEARLRARALAARLGDEDDPKRACEILEEFADRYRAKPKIFTGS